MIREINRLPSFSGRSPAHRRRARKVCKDLDRNLDGFDFGSSTDEEQGLRLGVNKHGQFVGHPGQRLYQMESESQKLVNARGFTKTELEEYQELPSSAEIFKETSYQPAKKREGFSDSSDLPNPDNFRRPASPASIPSDAYIVRPTASKSSRSSSKLSTARSKSLARRRSLSGSLNAHVFEKEMNTAKERSSRTPNQKRTERSFGGKKGQDDSFDLRTAVTSTPKDGSQSSGSANYDSSSCSSSNCSEASSPSNESSVSTASSIHSAYLDHELCGTGSEYAFDQEKSKKN
uniref:Serine/arginine repetitive matrix protein 2-like n=2 Tax=Bursaphelenchus xylophilus TaxID=6326 RepID=A0A1I7SI13_BURXY